MVWEENYINLFLILYLNGQYRNVHESLFNNSLLLMYINAFHFRIYAWTSSDV